MKSQLRPGGKSARATPPGSRSHSASQTTPASSSLERLKTLLAKPVNGASLAVFRICVGVVMTLEAWSLLRPDPAAISSGLSPLETYYTGKNITFHFPYELFGWLPLFSGPTIHALVIVQAVAGITMALGLLYRISAAAVFLSWGYLWVVESTRTYWQSHYYLETLLTFLMIWMPAARRWSADAWFGRNRNPARTVPYWTVWLLRAQLVIAYFYAGVAKLTADWILDAMPVRWFIAQAHVTKPYEAFLSAAQVAAFQRFLRSPELAYFLSHSGLIFDLAVGFLLLIRRMRVFALVLMVLFHATNHLLIFDDIGWFPLVGVLTALIFLDPDWPERLWRQLRRGPVAAPQPAVMQPQPLARITLCFVALWVVWQTLMPIRHFFIAGDGRFTYEGLRLSWRLKSEVRRSESAQFHPVDPAIINVFPSGAQINWGEWKGDKTLHRLIRSAPVDWRMLPEILVLFEPLLGERIIYNPVSAGIPNEPQARQRLAALWRELYGREIGPVENPAPLWKILGADTPNPDARVRGLLDGTEPLDEKLLASLRKMHPFALDQPPNEIAPFLIIEDPLLLERIPGGATRVRRAEWKHGAATQARVPLFAVSHAGGPPLVIHLASIGPWFRDLLPQACVMDVEGRQAPFLWWNTIKDLPPSKFLHVSQQAFYLRRYARRIADHWQKEYGRRPVVQAITAVSLNGRPHQPLVDPSADLASVPVFYFSHNPWIRQLETRRIPQEALEHPPTL